MRWSPTHKTHHPIRWAVFEIHDGPARAIITQIAHVKILWNRNQVNHLLTDRETVWRMSDHCAMRYKTFSVKANHNATSTPKIMRSERIPPNQRKSHEEASSLLHSSRLARMKYETTRGESIHMLKDPIWVVNDGNNVGISIIKRATHHHRTNERNCVTVHLSQKMSLVIQSRRERMIYEIPIQRTSEMLW